MSNIDDRYVADFLKSVAPFRSAYRHATFTYLAIKSDEGALLYSGRLFLYSRKPEQPKAPFESQNLFAGQFLLSEIGVELEEFIEKIRSGTIQTPQRDLAVQTEEGRGLSFYFNPFHQEGLEVQQRMNYLVARGKRVREILGYKMTDWELRAESPPFESLQELERFH